MIEVLAIIGLGFLIFIVWTAIRVNVLAAKQTAAVRGLEMSSYHCRTMSKIEQFVGDLGHRVSQSERRLMAVAVESMPSDMVVNIAEGLSPPATGFVWIRHSESIDPATKRMFASWAPGPPAPTPEIQSAHKTDDPKVRQVAERLNVEWQSEGDRREFHNASAVSAALIRKTIEATGRSPEDLTRKERFAYNIALIIVCDAITQRMGMDLEFVTILAPIRLWRVGGNPDLSADEMGERFGHETREAIEAHQELNTKNWGQALIMTIGRATMSYIENQNPDYFEKLAGLIADGLIETTTIN